MAALCIVRGAPSLPTSNVAGLRPAHVVAMGAIAIVLSPIAEEVFWRGYALDQFEKLVHRRLALLVQSVLWAFAHIWSPAHIPILVGYGLIFGSWRQRVRSLVPLIAAHVVLNAVVLFPFYRTQYEEAVFLQQAIPYLHLEEPSK